MPSVSAIIPVYNGEATIAEAVDSALALAGECDLEVIVVDDGSTDSTCDILQTYGDRIRVIRQANLGVSAARNHAVRESRGEYLAFLDADDLWLPGRISSAAAILDSDPIVGLVYCGFRHVDVVSGDYLGEVLSEKAPTLQEMFECDFLIVTPSVTMRRDIFALCGGYDERLSYGEDYLLYLSARHHCEFARIPNCFTFIRVRRIPERRRNAPTRVTFERVMRERYGRRANCAIRMAHNGWARMLLGTALRSFDQGRLGDAFRSFVELLQYQPSYLLRLSPSRVISPRNVKRLLTLASALNPTKKVISRVARLLDGGPPD